MQITFFSFFMSIFWSSILILGIYIGRKKDFFVQKISAISIFFLYAFSFFRAIIPIDFISSKGIYLKGFFSSFFKAVYLNKTPFINLSLFHIFLFIWLLGSVVLICSFIYKYMAVIAEIRTYKITNSPPFIDALEKVKKETGKTINVEILLSDYIPYPLGIGILNQKIILPKHNYTENELYYIILHEYTHFTNHDLLIKMLIQLYCFLFWWNPFVYLLKTDLSQILEIKCDLSVTSNMTISEKTEYMSCIVDLLKRNTGLKFKPYYGAVALLSEERNIVERFKVISNTIERSSKSKLKSVAFLAFYICIAVISYTFVFQPQYDPPTDSYSGRNTFEVTAEDGYILFENGVYFLIQGNEKITISEETALQMESHGFKIEKGNPKG